MILSLFFVPHLWLPEHLKEGTVPKLPQLFKRLWLHVYCREAPSVQAVCIGTGECLGYSAVETAELKYFCMDLAACLHT